MSSTLRIFRKLLSRRFLVYSFLVVLTALVGLSVFIQSKAGNAVVGRILEYAVEVAQPSVDFELGGVDTLGWNEIELKNVSLSIPGEQPALSVQSLTIEWSWGKERPLTLFCVVDTPIVRVESNESGVLNWNRLFPPEKSSTDSAFSWPDLGLEIVVPTIEVQKGKLDLFEQSIDWSIDMGARWSRGNILTWQLYDIGVTVAEMGTVRSTSHIDGDGQLLNVSVELSHPAGEAVLTGTVVDVLGDPSLNASVDVTVLPMINQYVELPNALKESITLSSNLEGGQSALKATLTSNVGLGLEATVSLFKESWKGDIRFEDIQVEEWLSDIEQTHITGELHFEGTGLDWSQNLVGEINGSFSDPVLWNQPLTALRTDMGIDTGKILIRRLQIEHADADIGLTGSLDTLGSNGQIEVRTEVESIQSWVPEFEARITGQHQAALDWSQEVPSVNIIGNAEVRRATDHQGLLLEKTRLETTAQWDGAKLVARNQVTVEKGTAVGVSIPSLTSTINVELDSKGDIRVDGLPSIPEVTIGEGTLQLNQIQGYFEYTQMGSEPKLKTENMTVGEVILVPAQYIVDGGNVDLRLEENALQAELHLLRKNRTFIHSQASADLQDGIWRVQQLDFSPTGDRAWALKDGVSFELTENGVGDLDLQLVGDAGDIHVKVDQYNNEPDIGLEIRDLDVSYVQEVANLFVGPDTIPIPLTGQLFGQVNLIGHQGRFQEGDYLLMQNVSSPDLINNVDLYVDLQGSLERIQTNLTVQGDDTVLAGSQILLPLDDGAPACEQSLYGQFVLSEQSFSDLHQWLPVIPNMDVISTNTVQLRGTFCNPKIRVVGQGEIAVGAQGERFKWEMDLKHVEDEITGQIFVRDGVKNVLESSIAGQTMLSDVLQGASQTELFDTLQISVQTRDVYLQRVGRLIGYPDLGKGLVNGSIEVALTPSSWKANGKVEFPKTRLAKHQLSENSSISFSADPAGVSGDLLIDFRKKGSIDGDFQYSMDDDSIFATLDCAQVPATILSIASSDIVNEYGKVEGHVLIDGTLSAPLVNALIELQNVGFELPSLGVEYRAIDLEAEVENGQVSISKLDGEARFTERGPLELTSWGRFGVRSTAAYSDSGIQATARLGLDNFPVINTDMAHVIVSGSIRVQQDDEGTQFAGDAYVHQAGIRLNRDFFESGASLTLPDSFHIHRNAQVMEDSDAVDDWLDEWLKTVRGTIQVDLGDRVATHTTMPMTNDYGTGISKLSEVRVDTILRGVLDVGLNRGEPAVLGTISTIRGSFVTMGKEFELGEGEVVFSGGDVYNPQLNLYAQKSFGEYGDVAVTVTGTVEEMELDFSAVNTPYAYDQTDIVTLMLLGKPSQELANSESQTSGALIQAGLSSMGGAVGDVLSGSVVDNVDWDPTESMFRVGKTLSDTMFLSYMMNYGAEEGENINEVTLEWLLLQRVYGEFITGDANNTEATVYYRWIF